MKKIFIGLAVLALSSCYLQGDYTLGHRNAFNDFFYTYNIRYYDKDGMNNDVRETETINNYKVGVVRHALVDGVMISSKTIVKSFFSEGYVRPNMKGALVSYTIPVELSDEKVYEVIGESDIKGVTYRLLAPNRLGDVVLIDARGNIYPRVGRIYNNRLALLDTGFLLEPEDLRFTDDGIRPYNNEDDPLSGFNIRYCGLDDKYRMVFLYTSFGPDGDGSEVQKVYTFPMYDKEISFGDVKIEVLEADETGISYRVL
ncbi:MAG: hypothetical protein J6W96_06630 [Alphaproteobacteria bacterium]|nr:hypothetical protein [Alphaproteobacteria bacterium]